MLLDEVDEAKTAFWIEAKILHFVDTYLRLETPDHYQQENMATDPVCGMRVNKEPPLVQSCRYLPFNRT
jgi:hypothetical protein